ncbi:MAG: STAS/SEC14 domain-containing protein [Chloroflexota bacterium]|nr:STAS/SEC14 domain-containing protein [Chloroflexota bacterium]
MKIYESTFYSFELSEKYLIFHWKDNTDQMSLQDFKDALMNFAGYVIEHKILNLLVFAENFKFNTPEEGHEWRKKEYNQRIKKVGDVKQALVMPEEVLQYVEDEIDSVVPVRYFSNESEARAWLDSSK